MDVHASARLGGFVVAAALVACTREDASSTRAAAPIWFVESAARRGVRFVHVPAHHRRFHFPEIMGAGAGLADYDADGDLDLFLVQSGDLVEGPSSQDGNALLRNRGDGTFEDMSLAAGVRDGGYGMGCAWGDVDGDRDLDLYVTCVGPNHLYVNQGDGTFRDETERAGVGDPGWGTSTSFLDFDGDGALDLFVTNYVDWSLATDVECHGVGDRRDYCQPNEYAAPARDVLYRNRGDGTFEDVTFASGIGSKLGSGLGVACADFDGDGRVDIYVANDMLANLMWINRGDGTFEDRALIGGCALDVGGQAEAGMGVIAEDFDSDGDTDLLLTHYWSQKNTYYENLGGGRFRDASALTGLAAPSMPFTGFGVGRFDFDHDGYEDVYVADGRVTYIVPVADEARPYDEPNLLFRGLAGTRFEESALPGGTAMALIASSRAAVFGDLDGDGDVDIVVANNDGPAQVLENVAPKRGHWVVFDVRDARGGVALQARVEVRAGDRRWVRTVQPGSSYCASNDARLHFGLGVVAAIDEVTVTYADGTRTTRRALATDRVHTLRP